ncbi:hypothetical protein RIF29_30445 [Crotalaria pallida]|uniref:Uncharacterized protein n=1 Tax=Crotalaria pallida TaxID=3830 RepID=A0AAN9EGM8_CROPI
MGSRQEPPWRDETLDENRGQNSKTCLIKALTSRRTSDRRNKNITPQRANADCLLSLNENQCRGERQNEQSRYLLEPTPLVEDPYEEDINVGLESFTGRIMKT